VDLGKLANPEERHATLDNGFDALVPASTKLGDYVLDGTAVVDGSVFEAAYELIAPDLFSA
jgi:hypothetical protein